MIALIIFEYVTHSLALRFKLASTTATWLLKHPQIGLLILRMKPFSFSMTRVVTTALASLSSVQSKIIVYKVNI